MLTIRYILQGLTPVKSIVCDVPQGKGTCYDYALIILLEGFQGDPRVVVATINPKIVGAVEHISELNEFIITTQPQEIEFVCTSKVTGIKMDKGWCYVSCSRYRVEMSIANDTDEGLFVGFDGEMTKLHSNAMLAIRFLWYPHIASHSIV
ncbi:hypothetical protein HID58_048906 [Brassica napus]|uniref:Uncharacterized protein n=1 Tax=Brassica napus TaxID=3708 RepID=A0ABQ8B3S7_BRANA|nr:hypothetical protein HID58_048906 [Brassica napus]